jgi:hypothetical protein
VGEGIRGGVEGGGAIELIWPETGTKQGYFRKGNNSKLVRQGELFLELCKEGRFKGLLT